MPIDMTGPRQVALQYLMGDTCYLLRPRLLDDGAGGSYPDPAGPERIGPLPCGFTAVSGDEAADDIVAVRGRYRLKFPIPLLHPTTQAALTPLATDQIEFAGKVYAIVWDPPITALSLQRKLGLKEA